MQGKLTIGFSMPVRQCLFNGVQTAQTFDRGLPPSDIIFHQNGSVIFIHFRTKFISVEYCTFFSEEFQV